MAKVSFIFQLHRYYLKKYIKASGHYITGRMLDIGAGEVDRYAKFFNYSERITTDIHASSNVDVVASADNLPFDDGEFDSIVCTQVLEHVPNPWPVVSEMNRVLKSGGHVLISVPMTNELHEEPHDYWRYTSFCLNNVLNKNNFEVIYLEQQGGYHSLIAQQKMTHAIQKYNLYNHFLLGKIASKLFYIYGLWAIWADHKYNTIYNNRHSIGYVLVAKKI